MKRSLLLLPAALLLLASCKEVGPAIDFGPVAADTAFTAPTEAATHRMVVIEEFTGVSCPPCPNGHKILKAIEDANPGKVLAIGIQPFNFTQANPVNKDGVTTKHDNRNQKGTDLANGIYGSLSTTPLAGIDRTPKDNSLYVAKENWAQMVSDHLAIASPANIKVTCTYNSDRTVIIKVHVAYTSPVAKSQLLNVAIVEDKVIDAQEVGLDVDSNYEHEHVLRDILTAPTGTAILNGISTKAAGQVYERIFVYDLKTTDPSNLWNPDNCKVIAYISNDAGADKEILQGAEADLK
jgi:hypothetical protein